MRIKTKLSLSVGFLFLLIILLIGIGVGYVKALSNDTQNILVANYNTIDYARNMLIAIDQNIMDKSIENKFKDNLAKQKNNITEVGEDEITKELEEDFESLLKNKNDTLLSKKIRLDLTNLMLLNMQAIHRKSMVAESTAKSATQVIAVTGTICFILAFTLLLNLPGSIANPIRELTSSIKEIAAKNYSQRVGFSQHNEFGELARSFNTMAQKLEEYNSSNLAKLMMEKKRIETLINNMHDPVIGLDENKKIIFINNEALKIAGVKYDETLGLNVQEIATRNDLIRSLTQHLLMPENTSNDTQSKPFKIYADGKESYFNEEIIRIEIIPTAEEFPKHIGDVILLKNITPYKELDVAKTNFIANVSHELKTPISSMMMSLQLLENEKTGELNDSQTQLLTSLKEDSLRLLKITGELLNMTQVEAGKIHLRLEAVNPVDIIKYAVDSNKVLSQQNNIQVELINESIGVMVNADFEKTAWVLNNLVSNALNYSNPNSKIVVKVNENFVGDASMISISVQDFGKGIESRYKDKIFDRYFQIPGSNRSGTGLGLAISKEFMEAQGGQIDVESEIGIGSVFSVRLKKVAN